MRRILTDDHNRLIYMSDHDAAEFMGEYGYRETIPGQEWAKRGGTSILRLDASPVTALVVSSTNPDARGVEFTYSLETISTMALFAVKVHLIEIEACFRMGHGLKLVESPMWDSQIDIWDSETDAVGRRLYYESANQESEECQPISWFNLWGGETLQSINAYDIITRIEARTRKKELNLRVALGVSMTWRPSK